ncbi:MAG TPA: hypothetical protein VGJ84_13170 [Polyangiaceae bacterium]
MRLIQIPVFGVAFLGAGAALAQEAAEAQSESNQAAESASPSDEQTPKESSEKPKPAEAQEKADEYFGHREQFGARVGFLGGYRMVYRYDHDSPRCVDPLTDTGDPQKFCGHQSPFAIDIALSYAFFDMLEPYAWARFGLSAEKQTNTKPVIILGAGLRFYTTSDSRLKVFFEPAIGLELEGDNGQQDWLHPPGWPDPKKTGTDLIFHIAIGPQYDFAKNVGVFLDGGFTFGILRSLMVTMELQAGLQARFP